MMMGNWWLIWVAFMFVFLVTPVGYGWGYRGWGPPYPQYVQRRRAQGISGPDAARHRAWGWGGDFIWVALGISVLWMCAALWLGR